MNSLWVFFFKIQFSPLKLIMFGCLYSSPGQIFKAYLHLHLINVSSRNIYMYNFVFFDEIYQCAFFFIIIAVGTKIYEFLSMHPEVLKDYSKKERVSKMRTKIINMRRQKRKIFELDYKKLTE